MDVEWEAKERSSTAIVDDEFLRLNANMLTALQQHCCSFFNEEEY